MPSFQEITIVNLYPSRYKSGTEYELWNYCLVYYQLTDRDDAESNKWHMDADNLLSSAKGFYIRKRTNDDPAM